MEIDKVNKKHLGVLHVCVKDHMRVNFCYFILNFPIYLDHQFHLCKYDRGEDTCTACPADTINPDEINTEQWSEFFEVCRIPKCECPPGNSKLQILTF